MVAVTHDPECRGPHDGRVCRAHNKCLACGHPAHDEKVCGFEMNPDRYRRPSAICQCQPARR